MVGSLKISDFVKAYGIVMQTMRLFASKKMCRIYP